MARGTEEDWKAIGESEPWWGVLSAPKFLSASLTEEGKSEFYAQGAEEMAWVISQLKGADPDFKPATGLDFGSGLGRLCFPMAEICQRVVGVDVSPGMRAEADHQKEVRSVPNVSFSDAIPNDGFDWINSYIVFQHILPATGYQIIKDLLSKLNPGGWTSLQLTFAHDHRDLVSLQRDTYAFRYDGETATCLEFHDTKIGDMSMYDYDMNKVLFMFVRAGISQIKLVHTDHAGVHGFWIFGKKD